jgi:hypothetical protein
VDISPAASGRYLLAVSDLRFDESRVYTMGVQCLFGPCPTQCLDVPVTTTTSTTTTLIQGEVTSTTGVGPTSTTLPASCGAGAPTGSTFASLACRLEVMVADVNAESRLGTLRSKAARAIAKATARETQAEAVCRDGMIKTARKRLKETIRALIQFSHLLRTRSARRKAPDEVRLPLAERADAIRADARALRADLACPDDAPAP